MENVSPGGHIVSRVGTRGNRGTCHWSLTLLTVSRDNPQIWTANK